MGLRLVVRHGAPSSVQLPGENLGYCRATKTSCDLQGLGIPIPYCCSKLEISMVEDDLEDYEEVSLNEKRWNGL